MKKVHRRQRRLPNGGPIDFSPKPTPPFHCRRAIGLASSRRPKTLSTRVKRGELLFNFPIPLSSTWREESDLSWQTTSWDLRRIATGGLLLESPSHGERKAAGLHSNQLGLRVEHVGQYGDHAVAKRAGFQKNDIIVSFDHQTQAWRETELFAHILRTHRPGAVVPVTVLRKGCHTDSNLEPNKRPDSKQGRRRRVEIEWVWSANP